MMKRRLIGIFIFSALISVFFIGAQASTTTTVDALMQVLKEEARESVYNVSLNAPFSKETSGIREDVSNETGALVVNNTILSIPGRNGMDMTLNLVYNNQLSRLYDEGVSVETVSKKTYYKTDTVVKNDTDAAKDIFGIGWSLDLPSLYILYTTVYVSLPDGQTYKADSSKECGLADYKLEDVHFSADTTVTNGIDASAYKLAYANGTTDYFTQYGEILMQKDRFGNTITYYWTLTNGLRLLTEIVDTAGRTVKVEYNSAGAFFSYGDKTISLYKTVLPGLAGKYCLSAYSDAAGNTTNYSYTLNTAEFSLTGNTNADNTYVNLSNITYYTGMNTSYTYGIYKKNLGDSGYMQYYKVESRRDTVGITDYNTQTYQYNGEPDGYPTYKADAISDSYTYNTLVTTEAGTTEQFSYNYKHQMIQKDTAFDGITQTQKLTYDADRNVPLRTETSISGDGTTYVKSIDIYTYDEKGNLTSENHPLIPNVADEAYKTTYGYDLMYNILTYKSYKQDENTTVTVEYTLSDDKKNVIQTDTYSNGNLLSSKKYEYSDFGNVIKSSVLVNPGEWAVTEYEYGGEYSGVSPTKITSAGIADADGRKSDIIQTYTYDSFSGNALSTTDGNGNTTTYVYDDLDRLLKETFPDGLCRTNVYDDMRNTLTTTDANGTGLVYCYDPFGLLSSVKDGASGAVLTERKYDLRDNLISQTDANGNKTEYAYDSLKRVTSTAVYDSGNKLVSKTLADYDDDYKDFYGNTFLKVTVTKKGDAKDLVTNYYYNGRDKLSEMGRVTEDGETLSYYGYDYLWNTVIATGFDGESTFGTYDALGRALSSTDQTGNTTGYTYDGLGNQICVTNPLGEKTYAEYDALGRTITVKTPQDGEKYAVTRYYYDGAGNLVRTTDPEGYVTKQYYNSRGFLSAVEQVISNDESNIVRYTYDGEGNLLTQTTGLSSWDDSDGSVTAYAYDAYGNNISVTDPAGCVSVSAYDLNGNLTSTASRNGVATYYSYDGLNRLTEEYNSKDGYDAGIAYSYDLSGSMTGSSSAEGTVSFTYDTLGRVTAAEYSNGFIKEYAYDDADRVTALTVKQGEASELDLAYEYDAAGRTTALVSGGVRTGYSYDAAGRLSGETNGLTGAVTAYAYTPSGALSSLVTYQSGEMVESFAYEYDLRGNQTKKVENGVTTQYFYDALSRLDVAFLPNLVTQDYEYDALGNISRMAELKGGVIAETLYSYDNCSCLLYKETDGSEGTSKTSFEYDGAGNLTYKNEVETSDTGTESREYSYLYNGFNQLAEVTEPDGAIYAYAYNAEGLRTSKTSADNTINYLYENGYILIETDGDGIVTAKNTWGIGNRLAQRETEHVIYGYRYNGRGDIIALTDASGSVVEDYAYDPYGNAMESDAGEVADGYTWSAGMETAQADNPFRYCGEYLDGETNTYYLRARNYDPATSRMLSEDTHWNPNNMIYGDSPLSLNKYTYMPDITAIRQSGNLYVYAMNNPIRWTDPSGKVVTDWDRTVLPQSYVEALEYYTKNWDSATPEMQQAWSEDAEKKRAKWRNTYEYTDDSGITRSAITDNEIKFRKSEDQFGAGTLRIITGYSLNGQDEVVLARYCQSGWIIGDGIGVDYETTEQSFTTDGSSIFYTIKYTTTISTNYWWIYPVKSDEGTITGAFYNLDYYYYL